jgi:hypothetical protein
MILVSVEIDPRIVAALDSLSVQSDQTRARTIRNALYSYVWDAKRNAGAMAQVAPTFPKAFPDQGLRVIDSKLCAVDEWGLLT